METRTRNAIFLNLLLTLSVANALFEGDDCVMRNPNEGPGKCLSIRKCAHSRQLLMRRKRPQGCGYDDTTPLVCCPKSSIMLPNVSQSESKCQEYYAYKHDNRNSIAGGLQAIGREFPHMAALGYGNSKSNPKWLCGGSLISEWFVLTAAHCITTQEYGEPKIVRLGDLNLNDTSDDAKPQDIEIKQNLVHPNYKLSSHYNDIALIRLKTCAHFNVHVRPGCIFTERHLPNERKLQAIGWGTTDYFGDTTDHLMKVLLDVIEHGKCKKMFASVSTRKLATGIDDDSQICAGDSSGKDTCPGDSGGPLQFLQKNGDLLNHYRLVGVTSFGKGCGIGNTAGVYTRIAHFTPWIEHVVWSNQSECGPPHLSYSPKRLQTFEI